MVQSISFTNSEYLIFMTDQPNELIFEAALIEWSNRLMLIYNNRQKIASYTSFIQRCWVDWQGEWICILIQSTKTIVNFINPIIFYKVCIPNKQFAFNEPKWKWNGPKTIVSLDCVWLKIRLNGQYRFICSSLFPMTLICLFDVMKDEISPFEW